MIDRLSCSWWQHRPEKQRRCVGPSCCDAARAVPAQAWSTGAFHARDMRQPFGHRIKSFLKIVFNTKRSFLGVWLSHPGHEPCVVRGIVDLRISYTPRAIVSTSKHKHAISIWARVSVVPASVQHWTHTCVPGSVEARSIGCEDRTCIDGVVPVDHRRGEAAAVIHLHAPCNQCLFFKQHEGGLLSQSPITRVLSTKPFPRSKPL